MLPASLGKKEVIALSKLRKANGQFKKGHAKVRKSKSRRKKR